MRQWWMVAPPAGTGQGTAAEGSTSSTSSPWILGSRPMVWWGSTSSRWLPGMNCMQPFSAVVSCRASQTLRLSYSSSSFQYASSWCHGAAPPIPGGLTMACSPWNPASSPRRPLPTAAALARNRVSRSASS